MDIWSFNPELFIAENGERVIDVVDLLAEPLPTDVYDREGFEELIAGIRTKPGPLFHSLPERQLRFEVKSLRTPSTDPESRRLIPGLQQRMAQASGVYCVRCGEYVKIGKTVDIGRRVKEIQVDSPHELLYLGALSSNTDDEALWHRRFDHLRARGEWFYLGEQIAVWIRRLTTPPSLLSQRVRPATERSSDPPFPATSPAE